MYVCKRTFIPVPHFFYSLPKQIPFKSVLDTQLKQRIIYTTHGKNNLVQ